MRSEFFRQKKKWFSASILEISRRVALSREHELFYESDNSRVIRLSHWAICWTLTEIHIAKLVLLEIRIFN